MCGRVDDQRLRDAVGSMADWLRQLANGIDDRPVVAHRETKSSGSENTYPEDLTDLETIRREIAEMANACHRLAGAEGLAGTDGDYQGSLRRLHDHDTQSHQQLPTRDAADLTRTGVGLLEKTAAGQRPVRLLGRQRSQSLYRRY